jgi:hypothetical protein
MLAAANKQAAHFLVLQAEDGLAFVQENCRTDITYLAEQGTRAFVEAIVHFP